ncbi:MAG: DUF721 domain-containing protein [Deltaproteobacteria bacterium]|nr:DUF721 domain-containing protein [Deltaproteobacteria bacterium]
MSEAKPPAKRQRRTRRDGPIDLRAALARVLDRHVPEELQRLTRIRNLWSELLPRSFTDHVWPMLVQGDRLVVHVQDAQWLHEMTYLRQELLERLLAAWPEAEIERLDAYVGELPPASERRPLVPPRREPKIHPPVLDPEVPAETLTALNEIRDPRLREALAQARMMLGKPRG